MLIPLSISSALVSPTASRTPIHTKSLKTAEEEMRTGILSDRWERVCLVHKLHGRTSLYTPPACSSALVGTCILSQVPKIFHLKIWMQCLTNIDTQAWQNAWSSSTSLPGLLMREQPQGLVGLMDHSSSLPPATLGESWKTFQVSALGNHTNFSYVSISLTCGTVLCKFVLHRKGESILEVWHLHHSYKGNTMNMYFPLPFHAAFFLPAQIKLY